MNNTTKVLLGIVVMVFIVWGIVLFSKPQPASGEPIKIGAILSLTGAAASFGEHAQNGITLAVEEINAKGGVNGRPVKLVIEDDRTDPKVGVGAFQKLNGIDRVDGLIGGLWDFTAQPIFPLVLDNKIAFISPSNFRIEGGFELNEQSFVMLTDFEKVIKGLKGYLEKEEINKLAVVHFTSVFGQEIADTLNGVMLNLGKTAIIDETYNQIGNNDFRTIILKLKTRGADAVFLDMVANDPVNFLEQARQLGLSTKFISYSSILDSFADPGADDSLLEGVTILNWELTSDRFEKAYIAKYNMVPTKSADKAYAAVYILAEAIAGVNDRAEVAEYLENRSFSTPNGSFSFTAEHAAAQTPVRIEVIKNGEVVEYK